MRECNGRVSLKVVVERDAESRSSIVAACGKIRDLNLTWFCREALTAGSDRDVGCCRQFSAPVTSSRAIRGSDTAVKSLEDE